MKSSLKTLLYTTTITLATFIPSPILAQTGPINKGCAEKEITTGVGCISTEPAGFATNILTIAVGLGGGIALLLLLFGFFTLATSAGIPDKVQGAKDIITSAIAGLILIVMATVLMGFIGINILGLPGLK